MTKRLLIGNAAFAHAALEAGVGIVAGYPGAPSTELIEAVSRQCAKGRALGVHVEWSVNEKAALEVCAAAAMSGVRALCVSTQSGLNVAADALVTINYAGVRGGLVLFVTDDPGATSSQTMQDTRTFADFAKVPLMDPATPEQGFEMIKKAFELSEANGTPVIVRSTPRICHASTFFDVADSTKAAPPRPITDENWYGMDDGSQGFVHDEDRWIVLPERVEPDLKKIASRLDEITRAYIYDDAFAQFNPVFRYAHKDAAGAEGAARAHAGTDLVLGIVCGGMSTVYAREALNIITHEAALAGLQMPPYRLIQIGTPYPMPRRTITRFMKGLTDVLVLEEIDPFIESEMLKIAGSSFLDPTIHGKLTGEADDNGENSTESIAFRIARFFDRYHKPLASRERAASGAGASGPLSSEGSSDSTSNASASVAHSSSSGHGEGAVAMRRAALHRQLTFEEVLERTLGDDRLHEYGKELPPRRPTMCAGCPHRASFYALKCALARVGISRTDAIISGDTGCYQMGMQLPLDMVDTCFDMGSGVTMAQGFSLTNPMKKCIAVIGDSTFFASGMTGIANAVYNNHDITIVVLDNYTTALCDMQPHPGTGVTMSGQRSAPIDAGAVLHAMGVSAIHYADPLNRGYAEDACVKALRESGPSAVVFRSPCIWLFESQQAAMVNVHKCTGCKKCIVDLGCPAISFNADARGAKSGRRGQACIDSEQCNGCGLCTQVCPFQAIRVFNRNEMPVYDMQRLRAEEAAAQRNLPGASVPEHVFGDGEDRADVSVGNGAYAADIGEDVGAGAQGAYDDADAAATGAVSAAKPALTSAEAAGPHDGVPGGFAYDDRAHEALASGSGASEHAPDLQGVPEPTDAPRHARQGSAPSAAAEASAPQKSGPKAPQSSDAAVPVASESGEGSSAKNISDKSADDPKAHPDGSREQSAQANADASSDEDVLLKGLFGGGVHIDLGGGDA